MIQANYQPSRGPMLRAVPCDYTGVPVSLRKRMSYRLIVDGTDVTPKPLFYDEEEFSVEVEDGSSTSPHTAEILGTTSSSLPLTKGTPVEQLSLQEPFTESQLKNFNLFDDESETSGEPPPLPTNLLSLLHRKETEVSGPSPPPSRILVTLKETPTIFHLDMPTLNIDVKTEEGEEIESDNEYYEYITVGTGRHRNIKTAEVQTDYTIRKTRSTMAPAVEVTDNTASANAWDLYHSLKRSGRNMNIE